MISAGYSLPNLSTTMAAKLPLEIKFILSAGIKTELNVSVGKDIELQDLKDKHDNG